MPDSSIVPVPAAAAPRRILIISDAWKPQVNGVVRTLSTVRAELMARGHVVGIIGPDRFRTVPCPSYPEINLSILPSWRLRRMIRHFRPDALHIATEGPLGTAARRWAMAHGLRFTTSYHTRFPEYIEARIRLPPSLPYAYLRAFHNAGEATLVATRTLSDDLRARGFTRLRPWTRGVDLERFHPDAAGAGRPEGRLDWGLPRPIFLCVGRIAIEKNLPAFLDLPLPGSKVVVGGGPLLASLRARYPEVLFTGPLAERELARTYASGDVFVFPSLTDTFGLVVLEALACGTPVAAFDVMGPRDILRDAAGAVGAVGPDLQASCLAALGADRLACRAHAERFSWATCAEMFRSALVALHPERAPLAA